MKKETPRVSKIWPPSRRATVIGVMAGVAVAVTGIAVAGCNVIGFGLYAVMAEQTKTVKAEYDLVPAAKRGATAVIRVWPEDEVSYQHEDASLNLAKAIRDACIRKDPETGQPSPLSGLRFRSPKAVVDWMDSRPDGGQAVTPEMLAEQFEADVVLDVTLEDYTLRAPGSDELVQGRISGTVNVYDFKKSSESLLPIGKRRVTVVFPDQPGDVQLSRVTERELWNKIRGMFAERVAKKLRDHEVSMETDPKEKYRFPD